MSVVVESVHCDTHFTHIVDEWYGPFETVTTAMGDSRDMHGRSKDKYARVYAPHKGYLRVVSYDPKVHTRTVTVTIELTEEEARVTADNTPCGVAYTAYCKIRDAAREAL